MQELTLIVDLRYALGDNGLRMQSELVHWARRIKLERDCAIGCLQSISGQKRKTREQKLAASCLALMAQIAGEDK